MSGCADKEMLLHALIDGELDAANSVAIEMHLKTCSGCAAELARIEAVQGALSQNGIKHVAPPALQERIIAQLANQSGVTSTLPPPRRALSPWFAGGFSAIAASLLLLVAVPQLTATGIEDQLIASHVRSLLANHLTDVATSNQHVVRPWFNGKIDFAPPVVDLADQGFPLVGGRLDYIDGRVVPALVYHRRLHTINLFIRPAGSFSSSFSLATSRNGYSLTRWSKDGLEYWAVSDIGPDELQLFQHTFAEGTTR
jgi:anti-sigma factor RsiW